MKNRMREILRSGKATVGTRFSSTWPFVAEMIGASGQYDYIEFAAEYSPFTQADLENICRAAELYNMGKMIKIDFQNRAYVAQKAIASGFDALMLADHKTAEEVRETLWYIRADYPGDGGRFGRPNRRFNLEGAGFLKTADYAQALRDIVVCVMIEKREAMDNLEEILAVPGVDMVQWGPTDYSLSAGWERPQMDAELHETEEKLIRTALANGVRPRCEIKTLEPFEYYKALGVIDFSLGDEMANNMRFWNEEGRKLRNLL